MKNCLRNVMLLVLALMLAICPAIAEEAAPEPELTTTPAAVLNVSVTLQGSLSAESASMAAVSSMRLLVVMGSPPDISRSMPRYTKIAPQPPLPGLPRQAPSV